MPKRRKTRSIDERIAEKQAEIKALESQRRKKKWANLLKEGKVPKENEDAFKRHKRLLECAALIDNGMEVGVLLSAADAKALNDELAKLMEKLEQKLELLAAGASSSDDSDDDDEDDDDEDDEDDDDDDDDDEDDDDDDDGGGGGGDDD